MRIYFPMTCNILTPGHIKCLEWLQDYKQQKNHIVIGLLTAKALYGYKKELMPFKDRKYILDNIWMPKWKKDSIEIVSQDSLNPTRWVKNNRCEAIASGDGWEQQELDAIEKLGIIKIDIGLPKNYSSSSVCQTKS